MPVGVLVSIIYRIKHFFKGNIDGNYFHKARCLSFSAMNFYRNSLRNSFYKRSVVSFAEKFIQIYFLRALT